jgi:hypothetical protein
MHREARPSSSALNLAWDHVFHLANGSMLNLRAVVPEPRKGHLTAAQAAQGLESAVNIDVRRLAM